MQKTCLHYIQILSQSKDIYILNFVFTFYVFSLIAILFICTRLLLSFSIVFGITNWMWIPYMVLTSRENKKRPNIIRYKRLNIFWLKALFKLGKRIWNKKKLMNLFVILSQIWFFYGGIPLRKVLMIVSSLSFSTMCWK